MEVVQGRARGVLIAVASQLPAVTVGMVDEMVEANECGVALEIVIEVLVESGRCSQRERFRILRCWSARWVWSRSMSIGFVPVSRRSLFS